MNKLVLITGATSGIGKATAITFAQNNYDLILIARRIGRLDELKKELSDGYQADVLTLDLDIRDGKAAQQMIASLPPRWQNIDVLVNNAGVALGLAPVYEGLFDDWDQVIDTNIKGLLYISRLVIPMMIKRGKGHVINIGSVAGREVYPGGNVYCATKFAVDGLTKAMRLDLLGHGIKVTQIAPGAVETEFSLVRFKGDEKRANKFYEGYKPLKPEDVAEAIYYVTTLPDYVNISDLQIMPLDQANINTIKRNN
jgi:NADP-dependent 3-hydroxy acid dehydrogenase YdfG